MKTQSRHPGTSKSAFPSPKLYVQRTVAVRSSWSNQERDLRARLALEMQRRLMAGLDLSRENVA